MALVKTRVFFLLILGITITRNVISAPSPSCRSVRDYCSCNFGIEDIEIICPSPLKAGNQNEFIIHALPNKYVLIQCSDKVTPADYKKLPNINIEEVDHFKLMMCPLSEDVTFGDIVEQIGLKRFKTLLFNNNADTDTLPVALKRKNFEGLPNITRLMLSYSLTDIPADLLADLQNLTWLDLRANNVHLPSGFFDHTPLLNILELGHNGITHLEPGIFANLTKLTRLNLWRNKLKNLQGDIFVDLANLKILDMHANGLESIPVDLFGHLTNLEELNIYSNNFASLPEGGLLENNTKLEVFKFYDNRAPSTTLPQGLLANLTNLKEVELQQNKLKEIPENIFWGSPNITNISLHSNLLTSLPDKLFIDNVNLYTLDLAHNQIRNLSDEVFTPLGELRVLKLAFNLLTEIGSEVFQGLGNMIEIDLDNNFIEKIDIEAFKRNSYLTIVRMNNNRLKFSDPINREVSPFSHSKNLRDLFLANNSIESILPDWRISLTNLAVLDLKWNKIQYVDFSNSFHFISPGVKIDLRYNNISVVDLSDAELLVNAIKPKYDAHSGPSENSKVQINGNPIDCSCRFYFFAKYLEGDFDPKVRAIVEIFPDNLTCASPPDQIGRLVKDIRSEEITCELNIITRDKCPPGCHCYFQFHRDRIHVNCSNLNLVEAPRRLPLHKKFSNTFLYLENNQLTSLPGNWTGYKNVKFMNVSNNSINEIEWLPQKLAVLDVSYNNLSRINVDTLEMMLNMTNLTQVDFSYNPWECQCSTRDFLRYIQDNFKKMTNLNNVQCKSNGKVLMNLRSNDICPYEMGIIIAVSITLVIFAILIGTMIGLYYRFNHEIRVWLFAHKILQCCFPEEELDKDKLYDAFVSYSHNDEDFVVNELVPHLEQGENPFKLCLHYRDWIAGEFIPNQIARSVEDSRRTLIVLTPHFLDSVWSKMEFRSAHLSSIKEGRAKVIVIKKGKIDENEKLDPELKAYLTMNTYIEWGDKLFWDKLRYALPHPPKLSKRGMLISRKIKESLDDKLELIRPISTPPAVQTPPAESADLNPLVDKISNGLINSGLNLSNGNVNNVSEHNKINGVLNASFVSNGSVLNGRLVNTKSKQSDV